MTLFATGDSVTRARLHAVIDRGYEEDCTVDPKVAEYRHISEVFEHAADFDLIHSHYDFMALTYTRLVSTPVLTTIHGFSSPQIVPIYRKYGDGTSFPSATPIACRGSIISQPSITESTFRYSQERSSRPSEVHRQVVCCVIALSISHFVRPLIFATEPAGCGRPAGALLTARFSSSDRRASFKR